MSLVLDDTTKSIEIALGGAVAANELEWTTHYADYTTGSFVPANNHGVTAGAADVAMVAAPAASTQRLVQNMTVYNADTAAATVTIKLDDPAVERRLVVVALPVGYSLHFKEDMWQVLDVNGAIVTSLVGSTTQHAILSPSHSDAATDAVTRGSIIYGNATPDWDELVVGAAAQHLESDGADISWVTNITMADNATIGLAGGGHIEFDNQAIDEINFINCRIGMGTQTPLALLNLDSGGDTSAEIRTDANRAGVGAVLGGFEGWWNATRVAAMYLLTGADNVNKDEGEISFYTAAAGGVFAERVRIDRDGHTYPAGNKTQDLGLAGNRWREIFCSLALNTGSSRLVPVQKDCPVCATQLVRSTGGLRALGEESDFLLAFCPNCGTVAMEELRHRTNPAVKLAPKIVFTGMEVLEHSGNTRSVVVNFRYGDDAEDEEGVTRKALHNSTTLSDDELAAFLKMADEERRAFLLNLGQIEWGALEKMEVVKPELETEQMQIDSLIRDLVGKDLLREVVK